MSPSAPNRRTFLASAAALAALPAAAAADSPAIPRRRLARALVLSGGGARGAYQAGIIDYLRLAGQIPESAPLQPYGIIAGTSIGAINGYFAATGQYDALRALWYSIAEQQVVRLKARYAKILNSDSGIGTRFAAAMRLVIGLSNNDTGVIDGEHLRDWLASRIDPTYSVVTPLIWTVTNLTTQTPEFFYLVDRSLSPEEREEAVTALRGTVGPDAVLREATPDILIDALRASTAIPIAFDPVELPAPSGGGTNLYVDGGVTANTPIAAARAAANRIDVVLMDPPLEQTHYHNALEVGFGVFGAMQRRILTADLRAAYLEHAEIFQMLPENELPVGVVGFDDRENIYATFKVGFADAARGFAPYVYGERE
ncbi:MAG TPA: patatin-like phospholipase family protein [Candidatus Acidoferrales bacterium]|nr:patatin-like phospholipase family protein [Candidatus Acidoferrales bacterium]